jgi:pimeloyl-ACP methyl ester carboxylesterase
MKLYVRSWGDASVPCAAELVHGIAGAAGSWWRVAEALVQRGYHCLAPDLRGHGRSPRTDGHYTISEMTGDLSDSLPVAPDLLVGFSLGGGLAVQAVLTGQLRPRRLLLVDPALASSVVDGAALLEAAEAAPRDVASILAANPRWHPEDAAERRRQFSATDWAQMRQILVDAPAWDLRPRLGELGEVPTLFVLADPSQLIPPAVADTIRAQLGPSSVVVLPNTTHSVYRDDFDGFLRVVDRWLETDSPSR